MIKLSVSFASLFLLLLMSSLCLGEERTPDYAKVSALLFPETKSWALIQGMKIADAKYLRENESKLREAYWASPAGKEKQQEHEECSFIERIFSDQWGFPKGFHIHDVDTDSLPDVIYSTHNACAEGDATLIWFGTKTGFVIRQRSIQYMLALRVKEGNPPRFSSVAPGCCGDPVDVYSVGRLINFRLDGRRSITFKTQLPAQEENPTPFVVQGDELVLRSSPERNDAYDKSASDFVGAAVFGNVLSKYLPACTGNVMGRQTDKESRLWYFVVLDKECDLLRTHAPFKVSAGWVEAAGISLKK